MGSGHSQEEYEGFSLKLYEISLQNPCVLPDIGIDESLLKYSGLNSSVELQSYSNELLNSVPGFAEKAVSGLGGVTPIPNAFGLGALVLSMILEIIIKSQTPAGDDSYSMLRRVFGEEKASSVRDKMSEYLKRHRMFIKDDRQLLQEMPSLEQQLSDKLTILKNSLLQDGQMSSRGFKIWVNGASFHVQMLIHEARLSYWARRRLPKSVHTIKTVIDIYLEDLDRLMKKYKTFKTEAPLLSSSTVCYFEACDNHCSILNTEANCRAERERQVMAIDPCAGAEMTEAYLNHVFSKYEPITSLKSHFTNIKNNIDSLIKKHDSFRLPART